MRMARSGKVDGSGGKDRLLVIWLWVAAAAAVSAGFILRVVASILSRPDLRLTGVVVIAVGIVAGGLGWLGERLAARPRSRRLT
jgi:hypothetical protein